MPEFHAIGELHAGKGFERYWGRLPTFILSPSSASAYPSLFATWQIISKEDTKWRHLQGQIQGRTWLAERKVPDSTAVFNTPLDFSFAFSSLSGWPSLFLTVYEVDAYGRVDLGGYGYARLPTQAGDHIRQIVISRPRGTTQEHITSFFTGGRPRYNNEIDAVGSTESRYGHRTVSMGTIEVHLSIILKDIEKQKHIEFAKPQDRVETERASVCGVCPSSKQREQEDEEALMNHEDDEEEEKRDVSDAQKKSEQSVALLAANR